MRTLAIVLLVGVFAAEGIAELQRADTRAWGVLLVICAAGFLYGGCSTARTASKRGYLFFDGGRW